MTHAVVRRVLIAVLLPAALFAGACGVAPPPDTTALHVPAGRSVSQVISLGQPVDVSGSVANDVQVFGADATIGSTAVVHGNVGVVGGTLRIRPRARIDGFVFDLNLAHFALPGVLAVVSFWAAWALFRLLVTCAALGAALLVTAALPRWIAIVGERARSSPWGAGRVGLWSVLLGLAAALVLAVTIVGAPVAAGLIVAGMLAALAGLAGVGYAFGDALAARFGADWPGGVRKVALGLAVLLGASFVPYLGPVSFAAAALIGLGATVTAVHAWVRRS